MRDLRATSVAPPCCLSPELFVVDGGRTAPVQRRPTPHPISVHHSEFIIHFDPLLFTFNPLQFSLPIRVLPSNYQYRGSNDGQFKTPKNSPGWSYCLEQMAGGQSRDNSRP